MSVVALPVGTPTAWRRSVDALRDLLSGIAEGFAAARRYPRLALMGGAELERRGLTRDDLAWFALYGERRPR